MERVRRDAEESRRRQEERIRALEQKIQDLQKPAAPTAPTPAAGARPNPVTTRPGFKARFYGFARADVDVNSRKMFAGSQLPFWVLSPADPRGRNPRDGDFTIHPRLSRLGLDTEAPPVHMAGGRATDRQARGRLLQHPPRQELGHLELPPVPADPPCLRSARLEERVAAVRPDLGADLASLPQRELRRPDVERGQPGRPAPAAPVHLAAEGREGQGHPGRVRGLARRHRRAGPGRRSEPGRRGEPASHRPGPGGHQPGFLGEGPDLGGGVLGAQRRVPHRRCKSDQRPPHLREQRPGSRRSRPAAEEAALPGGGLVR